MHPAYSVIFFTAASGAGYGLLALLALGGALGLLQPHLSLTLVGFGLALTLITAGLLSSTVHLGRPERAWRAFSQWRTSWLSREGVLAVTTFPFAGIVALGWASGAQNVGLLAAAGCLVAALALATVFATGQIYASLTTIRDWHQPTTTPVYLALALATGALLLQALLIAFGQSTDAVTWMTVLLLLIAFALKTVHWSRTDATARTLTPGDATGLKALGRVRQLDPPHTQANFVMREMGYAVGRKHGQRLRMIAIVTLFGLPILLTLLTLPDVGLGIGWRLPIALLSVLSAAVGVFVERWLFFAQAQHIVTLYYGAERA
jgi:sulfite dehydrogenase (quinone) subunit SoeC